jgi:hypothetical protein
MTKKTFGVLGFIALTAARIFAQPVDLSAGGGFFLTADTGGGVHGSGVSTIFGTMLTAKSSNPYLGGGVFGFFDAQYAEITLGVFSASGKARAKLAYPFYRSVVRDDAVKTSYTGVNLGIAGKFPMEQGGGLTVFPLMGLDVQMFLAAEDKKKNPLKSLAGVEEASGLNALWLRFGVGADYRVTDTIFVRFEVIYGIRLTNEVEDKSTAFLQSEVNRLKAKNPDYNINGTFHVTPGNGPLIRFAAGYTL